MKKSLISIIVPVYKAEKYISKCIDSILKQTYGNWELILVNDGSPDSSGQICDEYSLLDNRIKVYHKSNGGVSSARNYGLKNSKGRYVTFIDSDDWVSPFYLEDFQLEQCVSEDVVLISQGIEQFFPERELHLNMFKYEDEELDLEANPILLINKGILANGCPVAKIFDLSIIKKNNLYFNEGISLNEDHLFVLDYLYYTNKVYTRSEVNYTYLYDYTIPSLTKKRHSSQDSLNAAKALWQSFNRLRIKYSDIYNMFSPYSKEFGPKQLIRASKSTFYEHEGLANFTGIALEFKTICTQDVILSYCDTYSKSYVFYIDKVGEKTFYTIQFIMNVYCEFISTLKYFVKRIVRSK